MRTYIARGSVCPLFLSLSVCLSVPLDECLIVFFNFGKLDYGSINSIIDDTVMMIQ